MRGIGQRSVKNSSISVVEGEPRAAGKVVHNRCGLAGA